MRPRQFLFALVGAVVGALIGYGVGAALGQSPIGWATVLAVVGVAVGIGVGRFLGRKARLKEAGRALPKLDEHGLPEDAAP